MIKYSEIDNTAIISLNRPDKRNALHPDLVIRLKQQLNEVEESKNIVSVILTGEGTSFCAGADLSYLNRLKDFSAVENEKDSEDLADLFLQLYNFSKPVIAAVNGPAIAGGCGLASVCDFIVAHPSESKFGYSEVKIGFVPAVVSIFLIKKIGEGQTKRLMLSGDILSGSEAFEIGLVNYIADNVIEKSLAIAKTIGKNSVFSMAITKGMINSISNLSVEEAVNYCVRLNSISRASDDFAEGLNNFLNKKKQ